MVDGIMQLFNFMKEMWADIIFWYVVPPTQRAVVYRNGVFNREEGSGLHWKIPCIANLGEEVNYVDVVMETTNTQPQSLTTSDGKEIVISAIIKHKVSSATKYMTEVMDVKDAIVDITMSAIKKSVMIRTWEECKTQDLDKEVKTLAAKESKNWGIQILEVTIVNLSQVRSYRLIGGDAYFA